MIRGKRILLMVVMFIGMLQLSFGQRHEIFNDRISSLQVTVGGNWMAMPVMSTSNLSPLFIDFDNMTHEYHRYVYRIERCEADWSLSEELFTSDYIEGFNDGIAIENLEESLNTNVLYTHYHLQIPNDKCRLKMSGNYRVTVYDEDNDNEIMFVAYFMVVDPIIGVALSVTNNTDAGINSAYQQVGMEIKYGSINVTDPRQQIKTVVMQNGRWDNARINVNSQYTMSNGLRWDHCRDYIFLAGNEYRKFEMLDVTHTTMGMESLDWDGHEYHAYIFPDEPRPNYIYDEDANGAFCIRNSDYYEVNRLCEYLQVHFQLKAPKQNGDVYLNADWTYDQFFPKYKMEYNEVNKTYEGVVQLKQGYYSYQYLLMKPDGTLIPMPSEGCFFQTENKYQALVYFRGQGERTDRLLGFTEVSTK